MVRVLLVDDHNVVRAGLRALLESMGRVDVVGEASSGEDAVDRARMLEPDIVIMDLAMPGMDGVEATRRITKLGIDTKVLVLTIHDEDEFLIPALDAGAEGFLNKSVADTDLLGAVEALARGHSYLPRRAGRPARAKEGAGRRRPRIGSRGALLSRACRGWFVRAGFFDPGDGQGDGSPPQDRRGPYRACQGQARAAHKARTRALCARSRASEC